MSKTNLSDIFSDLNTESSVILPKSIKIKNIKNLDIISDATSSFMPQKGGYSDATSSFMPQKGGYSDATSSFMLQKRGYLNGTKNKDINQLISMLSATSDDNYTANSITEQDGGWWLTDLFKTKTQLEYDTAEREYNKVAAEFNEIRKDYLPSTPKYKEVQTKIQDAARKFDNARLKLHKKSPEEEAKLNQEAVQRSLKEPESDLYH